MSSDLKKTSIALAVAAVSGMALAAPVQLTETKTDTVLNNDYQQTVGTEDSDQQAGRYTSEKDIIMEGTKQVGVLVSQTSPVVNGPETQVGGINYRNYTYQEIRKGLLETRNDQDATTTQNGITTNSTSWEDTLTTGNVTRTANTRVQLDKTTNTTTEIVATTERLDDTGFAFAADDVGTVIGAHTESNTGVLEDVTYAATDERISSNKYSTTSSNLTTEAKLGADGKPISGQTIRVGTVESQFSQNNVDYQSTSDSATGVVTSKNTDGMLSSGEQSWSDHTVSTDYQHQNNDPTKDVVAFNLSADKKSVIESTVDTNKSTFNSKTIDYDDVNVAGLDYTNEFKVSVDNSKESVLDGFIELDKSSSEWSETQFNQAALGTSNALDYIVSNKLSTESKTRDFLVNKNNEIVLADNKPIINTETVEKMTGESYESVYQPTRYVSGDKKGQPVEIQTGRDPARSTNIAESVVKGTTTKVVTHKQDNDFQEHWNTTWEDSAKYARNHQENIEVDRDLTAAAAIDNKFISKITGVSVVKTAEEEDFKIGTVAVDVSGNKFTAEDVHSWKDADGKDHYYVVIGQDADGHDIRSQVSFKTGKPLETKTAELQTITTELQSAKRTDTVTMGQEVAYHTNDKTAWDDKETSKDSTKVYRVDKGSIETDVKVYSVGKNALHHEKTETKSGETVNTNFEELDGNIVFNEGKPVVNTVDFDKWASQQTDRLFQDDQDKVRENISTSAYEGKSTDASGAVQSSWNGHDNITTVDYAKDREFAKTVVKDSADELSSSAITMNVGHNYNDTAKANINSNTLRDNGTVDSGLAVSNAKDANIIVDIKDNRTNKEDIKVYQDGGLKALESTAAKTNVQTITYADGTTGIVKGIGNEDSTVTLFNKGKAEKYREAVKTSVTENTGKTFKKDEDGDIVLAEGQPIESGTSSIKTTAKTTENLYQIGQERLSDTATITHIVNNASNIDGSARNDVKNTTTEEIVYRADQQDGKASEENFTASRELNVIHADQTGFKYTENNQANTVTNKTEMGLIAANDVKQASKSEYTESLSAAGKDTVSITRGTETVNRTDYSVKGTVYGSETITTGDGTKTTIAKKETNELDKFGTFDSSTLSRTETKVAADQATTSTTETRIDAVNGVVLAATQTNTDTSGQSTTTEQKTTVGAGHVTTNHLVADRITLQGKDLQGEINRLDSRADQLNRRVDDVQKTAYRGIAIALAAQQAVPNIQAGQVAVFGGVGHYEGETAGSIGVVTSFTDRVSASGALGFAGGSEFGGRVGVAYLFGGK
ncbi:hypothetical protein F993_00108 [Acinetobacter proteolyticus]|uniref:Trimeric autotransporter adhesin YadA-like C-terminal membrane anchor domain-containing protein n=1 Tax=Acinetobacter proteolyticus TaxID=1776741 RepID=A0ABN0JJ64_9GAMM|nr:YadA C-terminal domain-containing protein [Acinetobacter proteolyticus]ENU25331.1 hypothetical protein F993_00108 [Acinetobacter proteolyticus]